MQTEAFAAFRGAYPFRAEFCAPAKGWEKGSGEGGVKYVCDLVFRPRLAVERWAALNALLITELREDDWSAPRFVPCASRIPNSLAESRIEATLRGVWRLASSNEVRSHASLKGHTPLTFAGGHMVARAELNNVR